jgi:hypothetical protein
MDLATFFWIIRPLVVAILIIIAVLLVLWAILG